jgi:hypothetical protein
MDRPKGFGSCGSEFGSARFHPGRPAEDSRPETTILKSDSGSHVAIFYKRRDDASIPDDEFEGDFSVLRLRNRGPSGKRLRCLHAKIEKQLSGTDISETDISD